MSGKHVTVEQQARTEMIQNLLKEVGAHPGAEIVTAAVRAADELKLSDSEREWVIYTLANQLRRRKGGGVPAQDE